MKKLSFLLSSILLFLIFSVVVQAQTQSVSEEKICVLYFYRPDCHFCQEVKPFIDDIELKYAENISLRRYDITNIEDYKIYNQFCSIQQIPIEKRGVPLVAINNQFLMGANQIKTQLEVEIKKMLETGERLCPLQGIMSCHPVNITNGTSPAIPGLQGITLPLITLAAFADSINPCAIGVLLFLLSFLLVTSARNVRRTVRIAGVYIATVYIVYLLAGIGILMILSRLAFLSLLTKIFAFAIIAFGVINLKDFFAYGKGISLKIPESKKPLIEKWVYRTSLPAAVVLGVIVAAVELPCTGGMYLAILALLANFATRVEAILYLFYYNFIFVLPLIIITLLFVKGVKITKLQKWLERNKRKSKLLLGLILVMFGVILLLL